MLQSVSQAGLQILHRFVDELSAGSSPDLESIARSLDEGDRSSVLEVMIRHHVTHCRQSGREPNLDDYRFAMAWLPQERVELLLQRSIADLKAENETNFRSAWDTSQRATGDFAESPPEVLPVNSLAWIPPSKIGKFEITRVVGHGSFGVVLEAMDAAIDRRVAIKIPKNPNRPHSEFMTEARATGALYHPNIIPLFEFGIDGTLGIPYLVFPFVDGGDLGELINKSAPMNPDAAVRLVIDIANAIQHAHVADLYHRDLKPRNILIDSNGRPYVSDFGLSIHVSAQRQQRHEIAGTLAYMAPEQVRGETGLLDGRSDVWGLGVILYEMLSKRRPFTGSTPEEIRAAILDQPARPLTQFATNVPASLDTICRRCLNRSVNERYASAGELASALKAWLLDHELEPRIASLKPAPNEISPAKTRLSAIGRWWPAIAIALLGMGAGAIPLIPANREPKRLAWGPGTLVSTDKLDATDNRLHLASEYLAACQIGHGETGGFKLEAKLKSLGRGSYGFVWGWHQSPTNPSIMVCHSLMIRENPFTSEDDFNLEWEDLQCDSQSHWTKRRWTLGATPMLGPQDRGNASIQLTVQGGRPTEILWKGRTIPLKVLLPEGYVLGPKQNEGPIGFVVQHASAELQDVKVIPLK